MNQAAAKAVVNFFSQMMDAVSRIPNSTPALPDKSHTEKLTRAARQFEAVLLNTVFGALEHSFSSLGEKKTEDGSDRYHFLGMQALATGLAARGGLGIGDFIIRSVTKAENKTGQPPAQQEKNLAKGAPLERLF